MHFIILILFINIPTFLLIKSYIWSIIWCDKGGKYNSLRRFKRTLSISERLGVKSVIQHISSYKKEYKVWRKLELLFIIISTILMCVYFAVYMLIEDKNVTKDVAYVTLFVSSAFYIFMCLKYDWNRNTKFDRIRMARKKK
jgi:hypothetical protein